MTRQPRWTTSRTPRRTRLGIPAAVAAVASLAGLAGCGSAPSCDQVVRHVTELRELGAPEAALALERCKREGWSDAVRSCAASAKDEDALQRCTARRASSSVRDYDAYIMRSKAAEAEVNLRSIERGLKMAYIERAAFPVGEVGPTPAEGSCCLGPGKKCAPDPTRWAGVDVWEQLAFEVSDPAYFSYAYRSADGTTATALAIGDLDCDTITSTFTLECHAVAGEPRCALTRPTRPD